MSYPIVFEALEDVAVESAMSVAAEAATSALSVTGAFHGGFARSLAYARSEAACLDLILDACESAALATSVGAPSDVVASVALFSTHASSFLIEPVVAIAVSTAPLATTTTETYSLDFETATSSAHEDTFAASGVGEFAMSNAPAPRSVAAFVAPPEDAEVSFVLFQTMGWMVGTSGFPTISAEQDGIATDFASTTLSILARDRAHVIARPGSTLTGVSVVFDSALAADGAKIIFDLLASAAAAADDSAAAFIAMLLEAADVALATGLASTQLDATLLVAALAEANDAASLVGFLEASDLADVFDAAAISRIALVATAMDAAAASDVPDTTLRLVLLGDDVASTADIASTTLSAVLATLEQGTAVGIARIAGETYMTYAMTLDGAAVSEISGAGFDSQATIGGRMYAVNENGFYLCEGDTDDGAPINASIYSGLSALGTQLKKATPYAYIGYTSGGTLLFKVSTTDAGVKKTNVYKLNPVQKSVVSDNRFQISKGLHSVYFGFELTNLDGADFELETIKVWRMPLNRRK